MSQLWQGGRDGDPIIIFANIHPMRFSVSQILEGSGWDPIGREGGREGGGLGTGLGEGGVGITKLPYADIQPMETIVG